MPTTNPVPSQDPSDLLFNAGKLDEVVSGSNATYTDRLGVSRRTMAGIDAAADLVLGGLGYAPPVAYAAGIALTLTTQTVEYSGEVYAPKVSVLPFTTSGTFETAKFRLIQGVASSDLPALVGHDLQDYAELRAYTGSATRIYITGLLVTAKPAGIAGVFQYDPTDTTSADNGGTIIVGADGRRWKRNFSGAVYSKWFGTKGDGVSDDTIATQSAIDYAVLVGSDLIVTPGVYMIMPGEGIDEYKYGGRRPGRGIFIEGALRMFCESGVEFKLIPSDMINPSLLLVRNTENVLVHGGTWTGDRFTHLGTTGEGGGLLQVSCCTNVTFRDVFARNAWGDGMGAYSFPAKTVPESGSGYTSPPTVTISGGGGSGATAVAILGNGTSLGSVGTIHRFSVTNKGSGYTSDPTVTLSGGGGTGALARAIVSKDGLIEGVVIVNSQICKNIKFENCSAVKNGRNNLSIGAIDGLTISRCLFEAADRIAPKLGIDIEPDGNQEAARNILIENCTFKENGVGGIALGGGNRCYQATVRDCVFINNGVGFSVANSYEINFEGNRFYGGALTGLGGGGGFTNSTLCAFAGNFIDLNNRTLSGLAGVGIASGCSNITFERNTIRRCNRGISIQAGSKFVFANNTITDLGGPSFYQLGVITGSQFVGNNISANTAGDGSFFAQATNCLFSNNRFIDNYSDALYGNFTDCEIVGNQFTNWSANLANAAALLATSMNGCLVQGNYFKAGAGSNFAIEELNAPTTPSYAQQNYVAYTNTMNPLQKLKVGTICEDNHHARYSAAPTTGTWLAGQRVYAASPTAGGNIGWVCTVAGAPGTWKPFGAISA